MGGYPPLQQHPFFDGTVHKLHTHVHVYTYIYIYIYSVT